MGLAFIMKVAGCRVALYIQHVTLGSAYSDTAAVSSCSRQNGYVQQIE